MTPAAITTAAITTRSAYCATCTRGGPRSLRGGATFCPTCGRGARPRNAPLRALTTVALALVALAVGALCLLLFSARREVAMSATIVKQDALVRDTSIASAMSSPASVQPAAESDANDLQAGASDSAEFRARENASAASAQMIASRADEPANPQSPLRRALADVTDEHLFPETYRVFPVSPDRVAAALRNRFHAMHAQLVTSGSATQVLCAAKSSLTKYYCWPEDIGPRGTKLHVKLITYANDLSHPTPRQSDFAVQDFYTALAGDLARAR
jgi:hypothetical protein